MTLLALQLVVANAGGDFSSECTQAPGVFFAKLPGMPFRIRRLKVRRHLATHAHAFDRIQALPSLFREPERCCQSGVCSSREIALSRDFASHVSTVLNSNGFGARLRKWHRNGDHDGQASREPYQGSIHLGVLPVVDRSPARNRLVKARPSSR